MRYNAQIDPSVADRYDASVSEEVIAWGNYFALATIDSGGETDWHCGHTVYERVP